MKKKFLKSLYVTLVLFVIFTPFILFYLQSIFNFKLDTQLIGFTPKINKPQKFTFNDFRVGKYQTDFSSWYVESLPLRGYIIKFYNTLRYNVFYLSRRIMGDNNCIHEKNYISAHLALDDKFDYSIENNKKKIKEFVSDLVELQEKLSKIDKTLYVFIPPSKVHFYPKSIPSKFYKIKNSNAISPLTIFKELVDKTNLNIRIASYDIKDKLKYPPFYSTGVHWSRTYEQIATNEMLDDLNKITNKQYRKLKLGRVKKSKNCFWRDCDVYNVLNIFNKNFDKKYFEYRVRKENLEKYDRMKFIVYGDSFSIGLIKDILRVYPDEKSILRINRASALVDYNDNVILLNNNFNNADFKQYLNSSDVIIIEMIEPEISNYTYGFVKHLLKILDNKLEYKEVDNNNQIKFLNNGQNYESPFGLYPLEGNGVWTKKYAAININNKAIRKKGIQIDFNIPNNIINKYKSQNVLVYINQNKVFENKYENAGWHSVIIPSNKINVINDDYYEIIIALSRVFVPKDFNNSSHDGRKLGIYIKYIGEAR